MHELAITTALFEQVRENTKNLDSGKVTVVKISLGKLASFVDDSINLYWQEITRGSIAEGSKVMVNRIPQKAKCLDCHKQVSLDQGQLCPLCKSDKLVLIGGDELVLEEIVYE